MYQIYTLLHLSNDSNRKVSADFLLLVKCVYKLLFQKIVSKVCLVHTTFPTIFTDSDEFLSAVRSAQDEDGNRKRGENVCLKSEEKFCV